jgi:hypothetical protein
LKLSLLVVESNQLAVLIAVVEVVLVLLVPLVAMFSQVL